MFGWISRSFRFNGGIGAAWCSRMHDSPRWPIHGRYECGVCGRRFRVPWGEAKSAAAAAVLQRVIVSQAEPGS